MVYTGYLQRAVPSAALIEPELSLNKGPFFLVTPGGGGDGEALIDWVLRAYESGEDIPHPAIIVMGPFMQQELQASFLERAARLERVEAITFSAKFEHLMAQATAVVAMGGYNTFCEILSFDKRALIVPRTKPRREQAIRATRAAELGLLSVLEGEGDRPAGHMVTALRQLLQQGRPSEVVVPGLLDGLENVNRLVEGWMGPGAAERRRTGVRA